MRAASRLAVLILCLLFAACATPQQLKERQEFAVSMDTLCRDSGLVRSGPVRRVERWRTDDPGYNVTVRLKVDGAPRTFVIRYWSDRTLLSVHPEPFDLGEISLGSDTVKDPGSRARCAAAVEKFTRHLRWPRYGPPAIQRVGRDFIVTYLTITPAEEYKHMALDPYVSFLVTPQGTVFSSFFGA